MKLELTKPIVFFDLETTGVNVAKDRIVEIGMIKVSPDGTEETLTMKINPTIPIPAESSSIHGIFDADVANSPTFEQKAQDIFDFIGNADLGGYNSNRFDVPVLVEEFLRLGMDINLEERNLVDVFKIFVKKEKRDLTTAYKFYCNKEIENAHSAEADIRATYEVLLGQLDKYDDLPNNVHFLHEFSKDNDFVDLGQRMVYVNGEPHFNFGKHKGRLVKDVLNREPSYYDWMIKSEFPLHTKFQLKKIKQSMGA